MKELILEVLTQCGFRGMGTVIPGGSYSSEQEEDERVDSGAIDTMWFQGYGNCNT